MHDLHKIKGARLRGGVGADFLSLPGGKEAHFNLLKLLIKIKSAIDFPLWL